MFVPTANAVVASRYRLVEEIGRGGMGCVWKAIDGELEAPCALKFILNQHSKPERVRTRFTREARAAAKLQSPHVVSVRGVGEWQGAMYIAMELLAGENLAQRLARSRTLSPAETAKVVQQVASVLDISHGSAIVHRDLKPENIWLWAGSDVFVKVLDFGVAKHIQPEDSLTKTNTGALIGTPHYMSPEQAAGDRAVDHRTDLWSLAVIAVECLSGQRPFQSAGLGQLLANIIHGRSIPLEELYPKRSHALQAWWDRATAPNPSARYSSALEFARDFSLALGLEPAATDPAKTGKSGHEALGAATELPTQDVQSGLDVWKGRSDSRESAVGSLSADIASIPGVRRARFGRWAGAGLLVAVGAVVGLVSRSTPTVDASPREVAVVHAPGASAPPASTHVVQPQTNRAARDEGARGPESEPLEQRSERAPVTSENRPSAQAAGRAAVVTRAAESGIGVDRPAPAVAPAAKAPTAAVHPLPVTPSAVTAGARVPTNSFPETAARSSLPATKPARDRKAPTPVDPRIGF